MPPLTRPGLSIAGFGGVLHLDPPLARPASTSEAGENQGVAQVCQLVSCVDEQVHRDQDESEFRVPPYVLWLFVALPGVSSYGDEGLA